ncbi:MAG: hypothetical protein AAF160_14405 [Pseudomonadota bacterium]
MSDRRGILAAFCLLGLAALQLPVLTTGFRVSGDDVEGLGEALKGFWPAALWGIEIMERDGRLGALTIFPLNTLGSWLSGDPVARAVFALMHVGVAALFGVWLARAWAPRVSAWAAGAMVFVVWCALHPVGVPHLPPHAFPMQLAPVFLLILGAHMMMGDGAGLRGTVAALLLFLGLAIHEYALLFGAALIGAGWLVRCLRAEGGLSSKLRNVISLRATGMEAGVLLLALLPLAAYRLWSGGTYDGVSGDGLAYPGRMVLAALGHVAASTALPEYRLTHFDVSWQGIAAAAARGLLAGAAALVLLPALRIDRRVAGLAALFAVASLALFTLPVVSSVKQQSWCLDKGDCAYLDARMAILPLAALVVLVLAALPTHRGLRGGAAAVIGLAAAATGLQNAWQVEHRLQPLTRPWERAAALACFPDRVPDADGHLRNMIDPWGHVASHAYVDVSDIWRRYLASFDPVSDCPPAGGSAHASLEAALLEILPVLPVGRSDSIGRGEGTGGRFLVDGWHRVEPWGVWSAAPEARLRIQPVDGRAGNGPVALLLDWVRAPFPDRAARPVTIALSGGAIWQGTGERQGGGCCTARVPLPQPLPTTLDLTLRVGKQKDIAPPGRQKLVGIGLREIALVPDD